MEESELEKRPILIEKDIEQPGKIVKDKWDKAQIVSSIVISALVPLSIVGAGLLVSTYLKKAEIESEKLRTASEYIQVISDGTAPAYAQGLALVEMLRNDLIEPDSALATAYQIENQHGPGATRSVFYEHARSNKVMNLPFGYFDIIVSEVNGERIAMHGWALDAKGIRSILV